MGLNGVMTRYKHGMSNTKIYVLWRSMLDRCENENSPAYHNYGGRGISVCESWQDFMNFYRDMGERPEGMSINRIDNDKGYSRENCEWTNRKAQNRNRRNRHMLTHDGVTKSMAEWSDQIGISIPTIWYRKRLGWSDEQIVTIGKVTKRKGIKRGHKLRFGI